MDATDDGVENGKYENIYRVLESGSSANVRDLLCE